MKAPGFAKQSLVEHCTVITADSKPYITHNTIQPLHSTSGSTLSDDVQLLLELQKASHYFFIHVVVLPQTC